MADKACIHTVYCEIAQSSAGSPLYFNVWALEEKQNRFEGITVNFAHICQSVSILVGASLV